MREFSENARMWLPYVRYYQTEKHRADFIFKLYGDWIFVGLGQGPAEGFC